MVNANILIDSSTFDDISVRSACSEGRLQISQYPLGSQSVGVTVTNSHFGEGGESDGMQVGTYGVVIGPGNVFDGIQQGNYARHVDSIQLYGQSHTTINGNYFTNDSTFIMAPDSLFNQSGNAGGTDNIIGMPTFVGGSSPATWMGYQLTSSSLGYHAGTDGKDVGAGVFGP